MAKKRADGRLRTSFMHDGRRIYVYGYSKAELKQKEIQKRQELEAGKQAHDNPTMDVFYETFTDQRRASVRESTIRTQKALYNICSNIKVQGTGKPFGEVRIQDVTPADIKHVQATMINEDRHSRTINQAMAHLRHVFNTALRLELIDRDPTRVISSVKRTEPTARDGIHRGLSQDEIQRFFEVAKTDFYYNHFKLMLLSGMRAGELAALTPADIDFHNKVLHIRKTVSVDEVGRAIIGDTKTASSCRDIPLTDQMIECIRSQMQVNNIIQFGSPDQPIFLSVEGHLLKAAVMNQTIERLCKKADIPRFSCHCFRHSFATVFIARQPESYKTLSGLLGHSDTALTLNLYAHLEESAKREAMGKMEIAL